VIKPDLAMPLPEHLGAVHFIGIGGSGMSGIARLFLAAGHRVTGSDRSGNEAIEQLRAAGAVVSIGHDAANVADADAIVYTGALWPDNPEYLAAGEMGIPRLHRSQALAWLVRGSRLVSIAGAHGKTTTTGMVVTGLALADRDPSFVNGGVIAGHGSSAFGDPDLWVVEADESDGSFLLYDTAVALITNVDADHLDHYGSHDAFDDAFVAFADRSREFVVISADDPGAVRVRSRLTHASVIEFGEAAHATVRAERIVADGPVRFEVVADGVRMPVQLSVPGRHNAINATGAIAVLLGLGVDLATAVAGVEAFGGTQRRFELHDTVRGVRVFDDYAHHPTEVEAALAQARSVVGTGRIIAVHQPHLYSRTRMMADRFAEVYERLADHTIVLDVYGAREDPEPGVTGALVADRFEDASRVDFIADWQAAADRVGAIALEGDLVMTLSCGDVYRIIPQLVAALKETDGR
jgi:UDP-N-acetylmuramate--alanine ligase